MSLIRVFTKTIHIALIIILIRPIYLKSVLWIRIGIRLRIGLGIGFSLVYTHFLVYKCL